MVSRKAWLKTIKHGPRCEIFTGVHPAIICSELVPALQKLKFSGKLSWRRGASKHNVSTNINKIAGCIFEMNHNFISLLISEVPKI